MQELPKRNDATYKEIEAFEDYEYSNCIAYEMAIRNDEVKRLIKEIYDLPLYEYCPYEDEHYELDKMLEEKYLIDWGIREHISNTFDIYIEEKHNKYYEYGERVKHISIFHNKKIEKIIPKESFENFMQEGDFIFNSFYNNIEKHKMIFDEFTTEERKTHTNSKPLLIRLISDGIGGLSEEKEEPKAIIENRKLFRFKRPRLAIPEDIDRTINLKINLNLPENELTEYILKVKREYCKENSIIKSPLEVLGESLKKVNTEIKSKSIPKDKEKRKKALADAFYVYDLWKVLEKDFKEKKEALKVERDNEIQKLKDNIQYSKAEREERTEELNEYYKDELRQYDSPSLKAEISSQSKFSIDTIEKHKSLMNKYINELKYKELITGVST